MVMFLRKLILRIYLGYSLTEFYTYNYYCNSTNIKLIIIYFIFVGEMDRDRATNLLESESDGTYLVRIRPQGPTRPVETVYALSLK